MFHWTNTMKTIQLYALVQCTADIISSNVLAMIQLKTIAHLALYNNQSLIHMSSVSHIFTSNLYFYHVLLGTTLKIPVLPVKTVKAKSSLKFSSSNFILLTWLVSIEWCVKKKGLEMSICLRTTLKILVWLWKTLEIKVLKVKSFKRKRANCAVF